ncbi:SGNH/GDSL hydrolase family protein [Alkalibacter mobilis]|uniref:SGNH/GDSL hydrolase family protein n=1 Tax=Alkalibacter mobilis TaxID=2787712 RepID=UPI00189EDBD7|nr:SGNH/GDSL hydrolase family protein [Alkalibacter mobilis]MBF7095517.1 SGNH/GDSL hydrolase family protein [Alkalibacter mobilis]
MNILCFGDSNTWGYNTNDGNRFSRDIRWTGILQKMLGSKYLIIEEGLNGRTTVFEDPFQWNHAKSGKDSLPVCLMSHKPLDIVLIMLGTNDMKSIYNAGAWEIAKGAGVLVDVIRGVLPENTPKIVLASPPRLGEESENSPQFLGAMDKVKQISDEFEKVAAEKNVVFIDIGSMVEAGSTDGIHLEESGHKKTAEIFYRYIAESQDG